METFTDLQKDIPPRFLGRDLKTVCSDFFSCSPVFDLLYEIGKRMKEDGREVVVLDAGCGVGTAIEELAQKGADLVEDMLCVRGRIQAIGVDLNPRPDLIPQLVVGGEIRLQAKFVQDDIRSLAMVDDNSIDVLYSVEVLGYVDDTLAALTAGWRTLREGGIMCFKTPQNFISQPSIVDIIQETPGADDVFGLRDNVSTNDYCLEYGFVVAEKKPGNQFRGFPWRMVDVHPYIKIHPEFADFAPRLRHIVVGVYEKM